MKNLKDAILKKAEFLRETDGASSLYDISRELLEIVEAQHKALEWAAEFWCEHEDAKRNLKVKEDLSRDWCPLCTRWIYQSYLEIKSPRETLEQTTTRLKKAGGGG